MVGPKNLQFIRCPRQSLFIRVCEDEGSVLLGWAELGWSVLLRGQHPCFQDKSGAVVRVNSGTKCSDEIWGSWKGEKKAGSGIRSRVGGTMNNLLINPLQRKQKLLRLTHPSHDNSLQLQYRALITNVKKTEHEINFPLVSGHREPLR